MATSKAPTNAEVQSALRKVYQRNQAIMKRTNWQWQSFAAQGGGTISPIDTQQSYKFNLLNETFYLKKLRLWFINMQVDIATTTTAGSAIGVNAFGLYAFLGTLRVTLGNDIYRIRAGAIPLIMQTFMKNGHGYPYRGDTVREYSASLNGSTQGTTVAAGSIITSAGTTTINSYLDIIFAYLEKVFDPEGIVPTLSRAGVQVSFTTQESLTGADATAYPFYAANGATIALSATPGYFAVQALAATQNEVMSNKALAPFDVSSGFVIEENIYPLVAQKRQFFTFQGQSSNLWLVKTIMCINNPGEVPGGLSKAENLTYLALRYNKSKDIVVWDDENNSQGAPIPLANFLVDQGDAYGDLTSGVYVFDWASGTDPEYPNRHGYFDLGALRDGGISLSYTPASGALEPEAEVQFYNMYLVPDLFTVQH